MRIHKRFQVMFSGVHHPIVHSDEFHYFAWKHTCLFWLKHIFLFLSTEQEKSNHLLYIAYWKLCQKRTAGERASDKEIHMCLKQ